MELFLYLIFLDLDKMDIYRDKAVFMYYLVLDCYASFGHATFGDEIWKTICNLEFRRAGS